MARKAEILYRDDEIILPDDLEKVADMIKYALAQFPELNEYEINRSEAEENIKKKKSVVIKIHTLLIEYCGNKYFNNYVYHIHGGWCRPFETYGGLMRNIKWMIDAEAGKHV